MCDSGYSIIPRRAGLIKSMLVNFQAFFWSIYLVLDVYFDSSKSEPSY